jgi:hypothetical protein
MNIGFLDILFIGLILAIVFFYDKIPALIKSALSALKSDAADIEEVKGEPKKTNFLALMPVLLVVFAGVIISGIIVYSVSNSNYSISNGHNNYDDDNCGGRGCVENILEGPGAARYRYIQNNCSDLCMNFVSIIMTSYVQNAESAIMTSGRNSQPVRCAYFRSLNEFVQNQGRHCPTLFECFTNTETQRLRRAFSDCARGY